MDNMTLEHRYTIIESFREKKLFRNLIFELCDIL